jgi:RNA polymerase sigma-70 factor (ECF subfamily)
MPVGRVFSLRPSKQAAGRRKQEAGSRFFVSHGNDRLDYGTLRQDVARAVARLCPGWLSQRREDLVQVAVMRVMHITGKQASSPEVNEALSTSYLYKVAYSVLVDEIRRLRRHPETNLEDDAVAPLAVAKENPERTAASQEIGRAIKECLAQMKRERRLAATLHLQGHTVPEAARILDWAVKQTENLVYRGLADLRKCLLAKGIRP